MSRSEYQTLVLKRMLAAVIYKSETHLLLWFDYHKKKRLIRLK